eukprot:m.223614 g.223614  ORF g.223614 m.223614 type:complete len:750 (+) comp18756_c0_seq1:125-2374(+)
MAEGGAAGAGLAAAAAVAAEPGAGGVLLGVTEGYATSQNDIVPFPEERIHRYPISDDYEVDLTRPLGDGANGNVYECRHRHRPGMFALKCLPVASPTSRQEINISYHVGLYRSEFVTRIEDVFINSPRDVAVWPADNWQEPCYLVVLEKVAGRDLMHTLLELGPRFTEAMASRFLGMCAQAVQALHELNIAHRDLKPENFLLTSADLERCRVKLCDLGHAKVDENLRTERGTPKYVQPRTPHGYTKRCDEFSLGVCAYAMLSGRLPFSGAYDTRKEKEGFDLNTPYWRHRSEASKRIVRQLLRWQEDDRITVAQLLNEPWIASGPPALPRLPLEVPPLTPEQVAEQRAVLARVLDVHRTNPPQVNAAPSMLVGNYNIVRCIARGSYGTVYLGLDSGDPTGETQVAIKEVLIQPVPARLERAVRVLREIRLGKMLRHSNVISIDQVAVQMGQYPAAHRIFFCMGRELIDLQSLIQNLKAAGQQLELEKIRLYAYQMFCGLKYLHSGGILHRDLKPGNILVSSSGEDIRICDLGFSRLVDTEGQLFLTDYISSRPYRAPEVIYDPHHYSSGIDMWAAGCIISYMLEGATLFHGASTLHQIARIFEFVGLPTDEECAVAFGARAPQINAQFRAVVRPLPAPEQREGDSALLARLRHRLASARPSEHLLDLLSRLLVFLPSRRLTAVQCLEHPLFGSTEHDIALHQADDEPVMADIHTEEELAGMRAAAGDEPQEIGAIVARILAEADVRLDA